MGTVPRARVVAMRRWPQPDFDRRDPRLNALVVVAYHPPEHHEIVDNLGMFITAVRDGFNGRWRFLEAGVQP